MMFLARGVPDDPAARVRVLTLLVAVLSVACGDSATEVGETAVARARAACVASASSDQNACTQQCSRLPDAGARETCREFCAGVATSAARRCEGPLGDFRVACASEPCAGAVDRCREDATQAFDACQASCDPGALVCETKCDRERAAAEESCGFLPVEIASGVGARPDLPRGRPADLAGLLDDDELAVVRAADARAEELRSRTVRLWTGALGAPVRITQLDHGFSFGFPVDFREFAGQDENLRFYGDVAKKHASLVVAETSLKWRNTEPEAGDLRFDLADTELAWAEENGLDVKAHVLLWGNAPPVASGSGTPEWLRDRFPDSAPLGDVQAGELRGLIQERVERVVGRYRGRIDVWEVTNEMLNPLTSWFNTRLGPTIVDDIFRWAREADPGAELVYNEWITEIFTGLPGPDAAAVRDRVLELRRAGVPIDVLGQQGHFAPGLVNVGVDVDLSERTRVDDYAEALDTLAEAGLPIHITEVTFAAPDAPEARAAQAEAVLRVWWGHPAVEQVIFWNFWNPLGPRSHLNLGVYGDDRSLTRHGEAIVSLLNDRWRTELEERPDGDGKIEFRAILGSYVAEWETTSGPVHVRFDVRRGPGELDVVAVEGGA